MNASNNNLITVKGDVDRIMYGPHPRSGFTIFKLKNPTVTLANGTVDKSKMNFSIKGSVAEIKIGATFECEGSFKNDPKYGEGFEAVAIYPAQPDVSSPDGVASYLSDAIKGVGKTLAKRIVDYLGSENVFYTLDENPDALLKVKGITKKKMESINKAWQSARGSYRVMTFLRGLGIGPQLSHRVFMEMGGPEGADVCGLIKANPYRLVNVSMVGFILADRAALALGMAEDSPERIEACALHILKKQSEEGHTYLTLGDLGKEVLAMLKIDRELIAKTLTDATENTEQSLFVVPDYSPAKEGGDTWVMLPMLYECEKGIVKHIDRLLKEDPRYGGIDDAFFQKFAEHNFTLDDDQKAAARTALGSKFSVVTGGPGMGKTAIIKVMVEYLETHGANILQVAPTGRAAKQLKDSTGIESMTAHRFISMVEKAKENEDEEMLEQLDYDVCIMDETSMTDTWLLYTVLKNLPSKTTVLLVGDIDQLASVGPGNVLGDLIDSKIIPVSRLTKVYRQGDGSGVASAAGNVKQGTQPAFTSDFRFTPVDEPYDIAKEVLRRVQGYLKQGIDISEIQVLSPMYKTEVGVTAMNIAMQCLFNPDKGGPEVKIFDYTYRIGDKVIQTKNNISKDIVNGDIGLITNITSDDDETYIHVQFDDRKVELKRAEAEFLNLAYAMTIHKSQGGQFQKVIMPMHMSQYIMLHRSIFYTGITRAKEEVDVIGVKRAVSVSVSTEKNSIRQTGLRTALITHFKGSEHIAESFELKKKEKASNTLKALAASLEVHDTQVPQAQVPVPDYVTSSSADYEPLASMPFDEPPFFDDEPDATEMDYLEYESMNSSLDMSN